MSRQQRRAAGKRGIITDRDLMKAHFDGIYFAVKCYSVAVAMVLHDKLGFGPVRLNRVMGQIQEMFDAVQKGQVEIGDLEETLHEETGIVFKDGEG